MKKEVRDASDDSFDDDEFIKRFENCTLRPDQFHHREHIRLTWLYLGRYGPIPALDRVSKGIRNLAAAFGKADRYHETITWAYVFLIHERMTRAAAEQAWEQFVEANPDLFDWKESILKRYYAQDILASTLARKVFVLPGLKTRETPD